MIKNRENDTIVYKHHIEAVIFKVAALGVMVSIPLVYRERMGVGSILGWLILSGLFIGGFYWKIFRNLQEQKELLRKSKKSSLVLSSFSKEYTSKTYETFPIFLDPGSGLRVKSIIPVFSGRMVKGKEYLVLQFNQKCIPVEFSSWKLKQKESFAPKVNPFFKKKEHPKEFLGLRAFLLQKWDPLGISNNPEDQEKYDPFIPKLMSLSKKGKSQEIAEYLERVEVETFKLKEPEDLHREFLRSLSESLIQQFGRNED